MIPLKIQLKNFLSYGPQNQLIDFAPHHLICLNGKNGHGKSALLDAITWALWGQARKTAATAKPDSQLLHIGQKNMVVIFEFSFGGKTYRIRREYSEQHGKPYAALDLALIETETGKSYPLTDKTIKATQTKIESLIGLSFETFVNSAFLRQGQSNEFSKKSPKERKEILASILNLQHYEKIRLAFLNEARQAEQKIKINQELLKNFYQLNENRIQVIHQLELIAQQLKEIEKKINALEQEKNRFITLEKQADKIKNDKETILHHLAKYTSDRESFLKELISTAKAWRNAHKNEHFLSSNYTSKYESIKHEVYLHQQKYKELTRLKDFYLTLREKKELLTVSFHQKIYSEKKTQQDIIESSVRKISQLSSELTNAQIEKESIIVKISRTQKKLHDSEVLLIDHTEKITRQNNMLTIFEKRKAYYHQWTAQQKAFIQKKIQFQEQKIRLANSLQPHCFICEQTLSNERKEWLLSELYKESSHINKKIARLDKALTVLKKELIDQHEEIKNYQVIQKKYGEAVHITTQLKIELSDLETQYSTLEKKILHLSTTIKTYENEYETQRKKCEFLDQQITHPHLYNDEIKNVHYELNEIKTTIETFAYNASQHEKIEKELVELEKLLNENTLNEEKKVLHKQLFEKSMMMLAEIRKLKQLIATIHNQKKQLTIKEDYLLAELTNYNNCKQLLQNLYLEKEKTLEERGRLNSEFHQIKKAEEESLKISVATKELEKELRTYHILATAFGKDGIQALLIEDALPEIEYEANILLAKLTHNQAHIIIDSLRDLKKGGSKETLDIKISDQLGIRPYEMFSGGEAFRIDFSLRIAISKLLARRAGTSLQTLIIDEGFGSLDEDGLTQIAEALYKIQDHFAKIIIVSHLPTMKEQFPTHFVIEKGAQGSKISILNNG